MAFVSCESSECDDEAFRYSIDFNAYRCQLEIFCSKGFVSLIKFLCY